MDDNDIFEGRLRAGLQRAVPEARAGAAAELDGLRPRFVRARRRRQTTTAIASAAAAAVMVLGATAIASPGGGQLRTSTVDVAGEGSTTTTIADDGVAAPSTTVGTVPVVPTVPTTATDDAPGDDRRSTGGTDDSANGDDSPGSTSRNRGGTGSGSAGPAPAPTAPPTTAAPRPTTPPTTAAPRPTTTVAAGGTRTIGSSGGSMTVRWTATSVTLVGYSPAAGWTAVVEKNTGTRVKVKFRQGEDEASTDARVLGGQLLVEVE